MLLYFPDEGLYEMSRKRLNFYVVVIKILKWAKNAWTFMLL